MTAATTNRHDLIPEPSITRFLFAGTAGANPLMALAGVLLVLAWRVGGWWGLDRWLLPAVGIPGAYGKLFGGRRSRAPR